MTQLTFNAEILRFGVQRFVLVPGEIASRLGTGPHIQVVVYVGGAKARTTMVPAGEGDYRLFLNNDLRASAGVDCGQPIHLKIERHDGPSDLPIPTALQQALECNPVALATFLRLTPGRRNEYIKFIASAKREATRQSRASKALTMLGKE